MGLADMFGFSKKRQDLESRIMRQMILAIGFAFIIMMAGTMVLFLANNSEERHQAEYNIIKDRYENHEISEETYENATAQYQQLFQQDKTIQIVGYGLYFGSIIIGCLWMGLFILITLFKFKDFMAERAGCDVYETTIDDEDLGPYKYQIVTPRDSSKKVDLLYIFLEIVRKSVSFQSILSGIQKGTHEITFSEGNILEQMSVDLNKIREEMAESTTFKEYIEQNKKESENDEAIINLTNISDSQLEGLIKLGIIHEMTTNVNENGYGWELIFRKIDEIKCLDGDVSKFSALKGMYVLIPTDEKDLWAFHNKRKSNDEYMIPISKCYTHFKYVYSLIEDKFALFICDQFSTKGGNLLNLKFNRTQIPEAEIEALGQFAYLAWIRSQPDDKKFVNKDTEIKALKGKLQAAENKEANQWLDDHGITSLGTFFERKIEMKPKFNIGNITMMILFGVMTFLIAMMIWR